MLDARESQDWPAGKLIRRAADAATVLRRGLEQVPLRVECR